MSKYIDADKLQEKFMQMARAEWSKPTVLNDGNAFSEAADVVNKFPAVVTRYIDADELIKTLNREGVPFNEDVNYFILHAPAADVVEVVRCGECIHWNAETKGCKRNPSVYRWYAKDFCSNGVR